MAQKVLFVILILVLVLFTAVLSFSFFYVVMKNLISPLGFFCIPRAFLGEKNLLPFFNRPNFNIFYTKREWWMGEKLSSSPFQKQSRFVWRLRNRAISNKGKGNIQFLKRQYQYQEGAINDGLNFTYRIFKFSTVLASR